MVNHEKSDSRTKGFEKVTGDCIIFPETRTVSVSLGTFDSTAVNALPVVFALGFSKKKS